MEKLAEIAIDNSLTVNLNAQVDQSLLAKNFATIVDALRELQKAQSQSDQKISELSSLKNTINQLNEKVERIEKNVTGQSKQKANAGNSNSDLLSTNLSDLTKRVEKNEANILDNIKDINLLNSDMREAKTDIEDLKKKLSVIDTGSSSGKQEKTSSNSLGINDIADNLSKELRKNQEKMEDILKRLGSAEDNIIRLDQQLKKIQSKQNDKSNSNTQSNNAGKNVSNGVSDREFEDLKRDLRDKLDVINKKINILQGDSNQHEKDINQLRELIDNGEKLLDKSESDSKTNNLNETISSDLLKLKKKLEELDSREKKDVKDIQEELNLLKQQLKSLKTEKIDSKTSLEGENGGSHRKLTINRDRDDLNDKVNDLIIKVSYLEKLISGSKNSLSDEKNPEKLPAIHRVTKRRDPNMTGFQDKDRSGIGRKDLAELKSELEAWLKSLLDSLNNKESLESLELKIQQLKKNIDRKADAEGTKKGFSFLENKITQLYLFLTEPETEDAMIVRKGFQCLSCSKKVEKLRGKLGPRINWNNMTSTNYTPPKVGYSRPMGDRSLEKEDDL